jgi:hypothetical protein
MAEVPDWLYEKYTTPAAEVRAAPARERLPVKDRDPVLYREFLNIDRTPQKDGSQCGAATRGRSC